jgi:hypothetical protein
MNGVVEPWVLRAQYSSSYPHFPVLPLWLHTMALVVRPRCPVLHPLGGGPIAGPSASRDPDSVHLIWLKRV